jgi:hypothetical protein
MLSAMHAGRATAGASPINGTDESFDRLIVTTPPWHAPRW